MVRETAYDVSEMAIVTYLQAKSYGKPLVLLPCVMLGRFQHGTLLYNTERGTLSLADLAGRRVGVRSYTQTTGTWLRGHLQNDYGVDVYRVQWVNFEDAHVLEYRDPPVCRARRRRQEPAQDGAGRRARRRHLRRRAAGRSAPQERDPRSRCGGASGGAPSTAWCRSTTWWWSPRSLSRSKPDLVREVFRMLRKSKAAAGLPKPGSIDFHPFGVEACRPALKMIIEYAVAAEADPAAVRGGRAVRRHHPRL